MRVENRMPDLASSRHRTHYLTALDILSGMGVPLHTIDIRAVGMYENYRGEVRTQDPPPGTPVGRETKITLEVGVSSIVDHMPYQLFYGLKGERKTGGAWEENARSLMAPFDAAVVRYSAQMHTYELRYRFGMVDAEHLARFMDLFEFKAEEGAYGFDDTVLWAMALPSLHEWGGNPEVVKAVLGKLFKLGFEITENVRARTAVPGELRYRLGSKTLRLGKETLVGDSFEECDSTYEVAVHGVPAGDVGRFLPGGEARRRIERILDYSMPGDVEYRITVKVGRDDARRATGKYLGYSSYI